MRNYRSRLGDGVAFGRWTGETVACLALLLIHSSAIAFGQVDQTTGGALASGMLQLYWSQLGEADSVVAEEAVARLVASPETSLPFAESQLAPLLTHTPQQVSTLIRQLDSAEFAAFLVSQCRAAAQKVQIPPTVAFATNDGI